VTGEILALTDQMAAGRIHKGWWNHQDLKKRFDAPQPIDRYWQWIDIDIEYEGRYLASEKVALVAGEGDPVQGAMLISVQPIVYEGVNYTPMELPVAAAEELLIDWEPD